MIKRYPFYLCIIFLIVSSYSPDVYGLPWEEYNKATKKSDVILIPTQKEKAIGSSIAKKVKARFEDTDDPLLQKRVAEIGARIAEVSDRQDVIYRFQALKSKKADDYNAFALPGGYVYVFDALPKELENDDELAAVIAHEVAHIAAKHSIKRLQSAMSMSALMILGLGMRADGRTMSEAANALNYLMASYSREAEVEADQLSVRYLRDAGFDPEAVVRILEFMKDVRKKGKIRQYTYYKSHPYLSERIARARMEITDDTDFTSFINLPRNTEDF